MRDGSSILPLSMVFFSFSFCFPFLPFFSFSFFVVFFFSPSPSHLEDSFCHLKQNSVDIPMGYRLVEIIKAANTVRKTRSDLSVWNKWCTLINTFNTTVRIE